MKRLILAAGVLCLLPVAAMAATYRIDTAHTYPQFEIRHLQFSMLHGQFNHATGTITMDRAKHLGSVDVTVRIKSLDTGDVQRDKDLLAPDFFDAAKYPAMSYHSTKVEYTSKHSAVVHGKLTLKGVTKPLTLRVTRIHCGPNPFGGGERCGFDARGKLDRTAFGVSGDPHMIPDMVHLIINADAVSKQAGR